MTNGTCSCLADNQRVPTPASCGNEHPYPRPCGAAHATSDGGTPRSDNCAANQPHGAWLNPILFACHIQHTQRCRS